MRDIGGFLILILALFTLLYLTVRFIVPFLLIYAGGLALFLTLASMILHRGRRRAIPFNSLLDSPYTWAMALLALAAPAIHLLALYLLHRTGHLLVITIINTLPPVVWTTWLLFRHRKQKKQFLREGHDFMEQLDMALARAGLLDLKIELMTATAENQDKPEQWEFEAGIVEAHDDGIRGRIGRLILEMKQLRDEYRRTAAGFETVLAAIRESGLRPDEKVSSTMSGTCSELDSAWQRVSRESSLILNERVGYAFREWDQPLS